MDFHGLNVDEMNTPEFLAWRRLHLSKSKLANCAEMAEIFAGFSVVVTVELQINDEDANPALMTAFVVTTSLLVSVSLLAVMISTCILPHISAVSKMSLVSQVSLSPHDSMIRLIDLCWVLTNTVSLFLFTLDVILMCWIKFAFFSMVAAYAATCIMVPVLIVILVFGIVFYRKIVSHQYNVFSKKYDDLERMHEQLEFASEGQTMSNDSVAETTAALRHLSSTSSSIASASSGNTTVRYARNAVHNV